MGSLWGNRGVAMVDLKLNWAISLDCVFVCAAFLSNFAGKKSGYDGKGEKGTLVEWQLRETECCQFLAVFFFLYADAAAAYLHERTVHG